MEPSLAKRVCAEAGKICFGQGEHNKGPFRNEKLLFHGVSISLF